MYIFLLLIYPCVCICRINTVTAANKATWRIFTYKELHTATNGFSEENKLGEGGFGSVYWGKTTDGLQVRNLKIKIILLIKYLSKDLQ